MTSTLTLDPSMFASVQRHDGELKFVAVQLYSGTDVVSLYVDPPQIGRFMDMMQGLLDQLDAMPAFDGPAASAHSTLDSGVGTVLEDCDIPF